MNKKKIIGILLVCIFILVCAGCQKQNVVKEGISTSKVEAVMQEEVFQTKSDRNKTDND